MYAKQIVQLFFFKNIIQFYDKVNFKVKGILKHIFMIQRL